MSDAVPTVIYDGECSLCRGTVRLLRSWRRPGALRFVPALSAEGRALLKRCGLLSGPPGAVVLVVGSSWWQASDAVWRAAGHLRWPYRALAQIRWCPRWLREKVYAFIARHRPGDSPPSGRA